MDERNVPLVPVSPGGEVNTLRRACAECHQQLEADWQFCAHCDARLATRCPGCGLPLPPAGSLRCGHCGRSLAPPWSEPAALLDAARSRDEPGSQGAESLCAPSSGAPACRAAALVTDRTREDITRALPSLGACISFHSRTDLLVNMIEAACPPMVIVDTDLLALPDDLFAMARSLRADVVTVAVVNQWSEREDRLRRAADAVLHKPARREEWARLFA
jgi:hypothetical protein